MNISIMLGQGLEQFQNNQFENGKSILGITNKLVNPTTTFRSVFIPGAINISVVVCLSNVNFEVDHEITIELVNCTNNESILKTDASVLAKGSFPKDSGVNFNISFNNVKAITNGEYKVIAKVDDELKDQSFYVFGDSIPA